MKHFEDLLKGGDLRSAGQSNRVVTMINNQKSFDELFALLFHTDRKIVMRAADAIEKITLNNSDYLAKHKQEILELSDTAKNAELKWHLALVIPRMSLTKKEIRTAWQKLVTWAKDKNESKIVRVNSLEGLFNLSANHANLKEDLGLVIAAVQEEKIPSITARIKKLKNSSR